MSKKHPEIDYVNLATADQVYDYTFPAGTTSILLQVRSGEPFRYAFKDGDIAAGKYITASKGMAKMEDYSGSEQAIKIYFSCSETGEVMEVEFWR